MKEDDYQTECGELINETTVLMRCARATEKEKK